MFLFLLDRWDITELKSPIFAGWAQKTLRFTCQALLERFRAMMCPAFCCLAMGSSKEEGVPLYSKSLHPQKMKRMVIILLRMSPMPPVKKISRRHWLESQLNIKNKTNKKQTSVSLKTIPFFVLIDTVLWNKVEWSWPCVLRTYLFKAFGPIFFWFPILQNVGLNCVKVTWGIAPQEYLAA